ncbi:MAG: stage III sporulation protein AE, partial [bacterium]
GCSLIIRNAIGGIGIVLILLYCLFPALKIISLVLTYRLAAALVQPIGDGNLVNCLGGIANSLVLIFAALALVTLMFFILLTVLIGSGNIAAMLR